MGIRTRMSLRQTMPRIRPEVEQNKVQAPELVRALNTRLGLKQSHTVPTLGTELLPVVVVDDLTQQSVRPEYWCACFNTVAGSGAGAANWYLFNPPTSRLLVKPKRFFFSPGHGGIMNFCINQINEPVGGDITRRGGRRLVGGLPGQTPPDFPPSFAAGCSLYAGNVGGVPGQTIFEQYMPDSLTSPHSHPPFSMDLPKTLIYPGSAFIWFLDSTPVSTSLLYAEWTEENLT
jgi:hypothetical protein